MHKVRAYNGKRDQICESVQYLAFFFGVIDGLCVGQNVIKPLLNNSLFIESIFSNEEGKAGEYYNFERYSNVFMHSYFIYYDLSYLKNIDKSYQ